MLCSLKVQNLNIWFFVSSKKSDTQKKTAKNLLFKFFFSKDIKSEYVLLMVFKEFGKKTDILLFFCGH